MYHTTMRRPVWYRALVALWALWFAAAVSDPAGLHWCAQHGDRLTAADASPVQSRHGAHAPGHAAHIHPAADDARTPSPSPQPSRHGPASDRDHHLGQCCTSVPVEAITRVPSLAGPTYARYVAPEIGETRAASRVAYAHPFANGPPAV